MFQFSTHWFFGWFGGKFWSDFFGYFCGVNLFVFFKTLLCFHNLLKTCPYSSITSTFSFSSFCRKYRVKMQIWKFWAQVSFHSTAVSFKVRKTYRALTSRQGTIWKLRKEIGVGRWLIFFFPYIMYCECAYLGTEYGFR